MPQSFASAVVTFWFLGHHVTCDCLQKVFWFSFKPMLMVLVHVYVILLLFVTQQAEHKFWQQSCMFRLSFKMFSADPHEVPNTLAILLMVILLLSGMCSFSQSTFSSVFLVKGCLDFLPSLAETILLLNFENHSRSSVLPIFCSARLTFNIFKVSVAFSPV